MGGVNCGEIVMRELNAARSERDAERRRADHNANAVNENADMIVRLRAELAEAKAEIELLRAEVDHLNGDDLSRMLSRYADDPEWQQHYLAAHLAGDVEQERDRLAAQVAAVRAAAEKAVAALARTAVLHEDYRIGAELRAALDGTGQDEARQGPELVARRDAKGSTHAADCPCPTCARPTEGDEQ